jgi:SAM-dependent methyltransferase
VRLDLGCGTRKQAGFVGVDVRPFDGVDVVHDLTTPWPWEDASADEVYASHVVEHFTPPQRIHFFNELHRVLKQGGRATIITPHWCSGRAFGDLTHQWPPVCEFFYLYLDADWRKDNAPHQDFWTCDFSHGCGHAPHQSLLTRSAEFNAFAMQFYKEAAQDLYATVTKK